MDASSFNLHLPLTGCRMWPGQVARGEKSSHRGRSCFKRRPIGRMWSWDKVNLERPKKPPRKKG